jgi:hypothetical protein
MWRQGWWARGRVPGGYDGTGLPLGRARNGRARVRRQYTCTVYRVAWRTYVCYMYARSSGPTGRSGGDIG